jgi:mRNA-degrading endonuclease toxin of MazEF toxin-antitoxin module
MSPNRSPLRRGRIIWAVVADRRGHSKRRPAVILTPTSKIKDDEPLLVMAITTTYPDPVPDDHVELPWHNAGHPVTRLNQRSAAVTSWVDFVLPEAVEGFAGDVPKKQMKIVDEKIEQSSK